MKQLRKYFKITSYILIGRISIGICFSYLEERLFCSLEGESITLYFYEAQGSKKCNNYLQTLEGKMNDTYDELEDIFHHIQNKQDIPYWTKLFKTKQQAFLMLGDLKNQVKTKMEQFEKTLFLKYKNYLSKDLNLKKWKLQYQINLLTRKSKNQTKEENLIDPKENLDNESKLALLLFQKDLIEKIQNAQSLQNLVESVKQYFNGQTSINENLNH